MKNWLRKAGGGPHRDVSRGSDSGSAKVRFKDRSTDGSISPWRPINADPNTWLEAFESHWKQANELMRHNANGPHSIELSETVSNHLDQMSLLLQTETNSQPPEAPAIGPILDILFSEQILDCVVDWVGFSQASRNNVPSAALSQAKLLQFYESIVTQCHHCLLVHKPVLLPLLRILDQLANHTVVLSRDVKNHFVMLLNQICTKMAENRNLMEFFFTETQDSPRFVVFNMLIPYLYDEGDLGQLARDAILLVLTVSSQQDSVGAFIAETSNFCPVLATGLSGCYSQLPRDVLGSVMASDDWHRITLPCVEALPSLNSFYGAVVFCNAVIQVGHSYVQEQLLEYIYHGFLTSVVAPSLSQTGLDELVSATVYLDLIIRTVTEPALLKLLIRFIITENIDGKRVIDVLVDRLSSNSRLSLVSFALFHTLLELYCEDLILELVLKYLIPCTHIMPSQMKSMKDQDVLSKHATDFLSLIPKSSVVLSKPSTSKDIMVNGNARIMPHRESDVSDPSSLPVYLSEYRYRIGQAKEKCKGWVYPYDGTTPDPTLFRSSTPNSRVGSMDEVTDGGETDTNVSVITTASNFNRSSSLRRSRPNSYFTNANKHALHCTPNGDSHTGFTALDLAVLGPDEFEEIEDDFDDSPDGAPSSVTSTPRWNKKNNQKQNMPTDYFKLAFDDDTLSSTGRTDSQGEESDAAGFVLRGWSDVKDSATFLEVLNRVRSSHKTPQDLDENIKFLDELGLKLGDTATLDVPDSLIDSGVEVLTTSGASNLSNNIEGGGRRRLPSIAGHDAPPPVRINFLGSFQQPCLGPFLDHLLDKLSSMANNTLWMNLQVSGVLCQLACYPQPLITSLLLNTTLVFQPNIKSIYQILQLLQNKLDSYSLNVTNYSAIVERARKWMGAREKKFMAKRDKPRDLGNKGEDTRCLNVEQGRLSNSNSIETLDGKIRAWSDLNPVVSQIEKGDRNRAASFETGVQVAKQHKFHHKKLESAEVSFEALRTKNMVYCAIVVHELVKELASLSLEHSCAMQYVLPFEYKF